MANTDVMIDLETLATSPNATILSIAGVRFNYNKEYRNITSPYDMDYFYCRVDPESQPTRDIDDETVAWWAQQEEDVKKKEEG